MANKTVYPFGTNGTLPGAIGIVNDLSTGGADKALSAEQGKIIGSELFGELYDATGEYTLTQGQAYGNVGSTISTDSSDKYEHLRLTDVADIIVSVKTPGTGTPSSLVQYVDSSDKITRRYIESYPNNTEVLVDLHLQEGETAVYVTSATGTMQIYDLARSTDGTANQNIDIDVAHLPAMEAGIDSGTGKWMTAYVEHGSFIYVKGAKSFTLASNSVYKSKYALLKSKSHTPGGTPDYVEGESGRHDIDFCVIETVEIPADCNYLWIAHGTAYLSSYYLPRFLTVTYPQGNDSFKKTNSPADFNKFVKIDRNGRTTLIRKRRFSFPDYFRGGQQEAIPIGSSAIGYNAFISDYWDAFLEDYPDVVTKASITKDSSNTYDIYKYVFAPAYYTRTIFLSAGMHGNEYEGFWGLYRLMKLIYESDNPLLRQLRHDVRFIIIPIVNPYGMQNKQRYGYNDYDQNYNYGVDWSILTPHTGVSPFVAKEPLAVKMVLDEYGDAIELYIDFHTDPYSPRKVNYLETDANSVTYKYCYDLTLDERQYIEEKFDYHDIDDSFVVWENTASTSFRYMEWVRNIPAVIAEVAINGYATSGSAEQMEGAVDFYINVIITMVANCT